MNKRQTGGYDYLYFDQVLRIPNFCWVNENLILFSQYYSMSRNCVRLIALRISQGTEGQMMMKGLRGMLGGSF